MKNITILTWPLCFCTGALLTALVVILGGCDKEKVLPTLPREMVGDLNSVSVHTRPGNSVEDVSFSFIDADGKWHVAEVSVVNGTSRKANADITLSELDIVTNESTIQFFSRGLYGVAKTIVEAYPIKRLSVVITFHEGAKIGFYNPANDGQTDPLEYLDAPKQIIIHASDSAYATYTPFGGLSEQWTVQYLDRKKFIEAFRPALIGLVDQDPDTPGLQKVPIDVYLPFDNPFY
jgi:hypothetical protein